MAVADPRAPAPRGAQPSPCDAGVRGVRRWGWPARWLTAGPAPLEPGFTCQISRGVAVVRVTGEIDMATRDDLLATITRYAHDDRVDGVIVDLDGVSFLDCTGVSALLAGRREAVESRCDFEVVNPQRAVLRVLRLTNTVEVLGMPGGDGS